MSRNKTPSLPPQRGMLEHKPTKVDGGLPAPSLVKRPPPPPKQSDGGGR
jgi:hypothetical protein